MSNSVRRSTTKVKYLVCVISLLALCSRGMPSQAAITSECDDVCFLDTDCNQYCVYTPPEPYEALERTCGEHRGSYCGNTCDIACGTWVDGSTECSANGGEPTTCEGYGVYLRCGDDACERDYGENENTCASDCAPEAEVNEGNIWDLYDLLVDMQAAGALNGSMGGYELAVQMAHDAGWLTETDAYAAGPESGMTCSDKAAKIAGAKKLKRGLSRIGILYGLGAIVAGAIPGGQVAAVAFGSASILAFAGSNEVGYLEEALQSASCLPLPA